MVVHSVRSIASMSWHPTRFLPEHLRKRDRESWINLCRYRLYVTLSQGRISEPEGISLPSLKVLWGSGWLWSAERTPLELEYRFMCPSVVDFPRIPVFGNEMIFFAEDTEPERIFPVNFLLKYAEEIVLVNFTLQLGPRLGLSLVISRGELQFLNDAQILFMVRIISHITVDYLLRSFVQFFGCNPSSGPWQKLSLVPNPPHPEILGWPISRVTVCSSGITVYPNFRIY